MASLSSLPAELILRIFDFVPPQNHLDFALVSKQIAAPAKDVFDHHRRCRQRYQRTQIALDGNTIHTLWRKILDDPVVAWHIRTLYLDQVEWHLLDQVEWGPEVAPDEEERLCSTLEVEKLTNILLGRKAVDDSTDRTPSACAESFDLRDGHDGWRRKTTAISTPFHEGSNLGLSPYDTEDLERCFEEAPITIRQVLLIAALCPRLDSFKTIRESDLDQAEPNARSVVPLLSELAHYLSRCPEEAVTAAWPLGLMNLRSITTIAVDIHYRPTTTIDLLMRLTLLPNLQSLRISWLRFSDAEHFNGSHDCPEIRNTSLQHLFFDCCSDTVTGARIDAIIKPFKALRSMVLTDSNFLDVDLCKQTLFDNCGSTLESFVFTGSRHDTFPNRQLPVEPGWDNLAKLQVIRTLTVDVLEMFPCGSRRSIVEKTYGHETIEETQRRFVRSLPTTLETLIFVETGHQRMNDKEMGHFGDFIVQLVKEKRCPGLVAIYADEFESSMRDSRSRWGMPTEGGWLREAKRRVQELDLGVILYTQDDVDATEAFLEDLYGRIEPSWAEPPSADASYATGSGR